MWNGHELHVFGVRSCLGIIHGLDLRAHEERPAQAGIPISERRCAYERDEHSLNQSRSTNHEEVRPLEHRLTKVEVVQLLARGDGGFGRTGGAGG